MSNIVPVHTSVETRIDYRELLLNSPFIIDMSPYYPVVGGYVDPGGELSVGDINVEGDSDTW
jgi:hypothetical protein